MTPVQLSLWIALPIMIGLSVGFYFWLRNKRLALKIIPFMVVVLLVVVLEIIKQIVGLSRESYSLFWLPFHICAGFTFFAPFAVFTKQKSRAGNIFWDLAIVFSLLGGIALYGDPEATVGAAPVFGSGNFMRYHSLFFHLLLAQFALLAIALRPHRPESRDMKWALVIFGVYVMFLALMANILDTNFAMFINNSIWPFPALKERIGLWSMQIVLWLVYMFLAVAVGVLVILFRKRVRRNDQN